MSELETAYQEFEEELEGDFEDEYEFEEELEGDFEDEYEFEDESEEFFRKSWFRKIKRMAKKIAPVLKKVASPAARVVATAVGGPAAGAIAGKAARYLSREDEFEYELEDEFESEYELEDEFESEYELEDEFESEYELEDEFEAAVADILADTASKVSSEAEAEAYAGAATAKLIKPKSTSMQKVVPHVIKGAAKLTKTLRKSPSSRPLVKMVPTIARLTNKTLTKQAAKGKKITRPLVANVMAKHTKKVLSNPMTCAKTLLKTPTKTRKTGKKRLSRA